MHVLGHSGALAPDEKRVRGLEAEVHVGQAGRGREQHEPRGPAAAALVEGGEGGVAGDIHMGEIVERGPSERAIGDVESGRFDEVHRDPEARRKPQHRPGILRYVRLECG